MALRSSRRLPKKFNRRVSSQVKLFMRKQKKQGNKKGLKRRMSRKAKVFTQALSKWRVFALRLLIALLIIGVVGGIAGLMFSPFFRLEEIRIQRRQARLDVQEVQHILQQLFNKHLYLISRQEVEDLLTEHISDVAEVSIVKEYPRTLIVSVLLDEVIARIEIADPDGGNQDEEIEEEADTKERKQYDFLTRNGVYILDPLEKHGKPLPVIRIVDWSLRPVPGAVIADPLLLQKMRQAEEILKRQFGQEVVERILYVRAQEFHLKTETMTLWFDIVSTVEEQIGRYRMFLRVVDPAVVEEYVDLRLRDKIIYK